MREQYLERIARADGWRLPDDYPVVVDPHGKIVARFADFVWCLDTGESRPMSINFGDGLQRAGGRRIDSLNAFLLRRIVAMWLLGPKPFERPATIMAYFVALRPIFLLCSERGIAASELRCHPAIAGELVTVIAPSKASDALMLMHTLYNRRNELGFFLLDDFGLKRLSAAIPDHQSRQTAYIPPRIWLYQVTRLKKFLDEYLLHEKQIEQCFSYCLHAYATQRGGVNAAFERGRWRPPFSMPSPGTRNASYFGTFAQTAEQFGILELLQQWTVRKRSEKTLAISSFSNYLTAATRVSAAYIANMSLMRISEVWDLREGCLIIENDQDFGPIYTLSGRTTKTTFDDDARWITSPSVATAIDVCQHVSTMRELCARANPGIQIVSQDAQAKRLFLTAYEPWSQRYGRNADMRGSSNYPSYQCVVAEHPRLFCNEQLLITPDDLDVANLVNPDLNRSVYVVGKVWPFAWHQLRRTGAVNMQSSGLVSDPTLQYQLKHASRAMALYYGRGFGKLCLRRDAATTYVRAMYEAVGARISSLAQEVFVSPYGLERKTQILEPVSGQDHKFLIEAAKNGSIAWRDTLFGGCTKRGWCPFGGIDNVIRCGGGDGKEPCADAIFDRRKLPEIAQFREVVLKRIAAAEPTSPLHDSLQAQLISIDRTLNVLK